MKKYILFVLFFPICTYGASSSHDCGSSNNATEKKQATPYPCLLWNDILKKSSRTVLLNYLEYCIISETSQIESCIIPTSIPLITLALTDAEKKKAVVACTFVDYDHQPLIEILKNTFSSSSPQSLSVQMISACFYDDKGMAETIKAWGSLIKSDVLLKEVAKKPHIKGLHIMSALLMTEFKLNKSQVKPTLYCASTRDNDGLVFNEGKIYSLLAEDKKRLLTLVPERPYGAHFRRIPDDSADIKLDALLKS